MDENKRIFRVVGDLEAEVGRYRIGYITDGCIKLIDKELIQFDDYDEALDYIENNQEKLNEIVDLIEEAEKQEENNEENQEVVETAKTNNQTKSRAIAWMLTGTAAMGLGHFAAKGIVETVRENKKNNTTYEEPIEEETDKEYFYLNDGRVVYYDSNTNDVVISDMSVSQAIENISTSDEKITVEAFEGLVASYARPYILNNIAGLDTEMITKFVFMANINTIAEELPEFFEEFTSVHDYNEMMSDFGRVIAATNHYNVELRNENGTLDGFINVSDALFEGTSKENMTTIEAQMLEIHEAAIKEDGELVNELVLELIDELRSGSLSKLEDGVGMAAQVPISLIADNIAKDYLNEYNFNVLNGSIDPETGYRNDDGLKFSNKYVSNIQNIYTNGCISDTYTKTLSR